MFKKYLGKYNDILLGLVLIPVINTINYHLTYSTIRWDWYTITTYLIDTFQGWISWWLMRSVVLWLDKRLPYESGLIKRIGVQLFWSNLSILGFIISTTWAINELFGDGPLPSDFYTYNLFIFFIWILVINSIYIGLYFYDQWQRSQELFENERALKTKGFQVRKGKQINNISFSQIGAFHSEEGLTYLTTMEGERFVVDSSLGNILEDLPGTMFYRINRKYILSRDIIDGYYKESYGKLRVNLRDRFPLPEHPIISRLTAPGFKEWLGKAVQRS
jgi:hypothetical protein